MDKETERQIWLRVYGGDTQPPARLTPRQRQQLRQALNRSMENLRTYQSMANHPYYGDAFAHMAADTQEHIKMLRQMLGL